MTAPPHEATAEWRHVVERFHGFIAALRPTPEEEEDAALARARVVACLRAHLGRADILPLKGLGESADDEHLLVGSHAKGTVMRGHCGLDLLYALPASLRARIGDGNGTALVRELVAALSGRYASIDWADGGWIAVRPETRTVVRLLPCFPCSDGGYLIGTGRARGDAFAGLRYVNPAEEMAALARADELSGHKASHLILMLKAWRRAHAIPLASLAIELLVTEFVSVWNYYRQSLLFYDWMVRDFFFWLGFQGGRMLAIPGTLNRIAVDEAWIETADAAYRAAMRASALERDNESARALAEWRRIFGDAVAGPAGSTERVARLPSVAAS